MQSPHFHSFGVIKYHLFVMCSANSSMSKDGMLKDSRTMSPTHVTLKAGVKPILVLDGYVNFAL